MALNNVFDASNVFQSVNILSVVSKQLALILQHFDKHVRRRRPEVGC